MTHITFKGGRVVMRDGKIGTESDCCCGGCEDCTLTCCLTINGRNTCAGETITISTFPELIVLLWTSHIQENGVTTGIYQYLSDDFDVLVEFDWICSDGVLGLDIRLLEWIPGNAGLGDPAVTYRRWANARAILGDSGCPTGIDLGEPTVSNGPEPANMPAFGWAFT